MHQLGMDQGLARIRCAEALQEAARERAERRAQTVASRPAARQLTLCLLPLVAGVGAALVLLILAGDPARLAYASTLTFLSCVSTIQGCIDIATAGDAILNITSTYCQNLKVREGAPDQADFAKIGG
jgi:hypothetical protein